MPPPFTSTVMEVAPASSAFSISSLTTELGRSTTSPAAIRPTVAASSMRIGMLSSRQSFIPKSIPVFSETMRQPRSSSAPRITGRKPNSW